MIWVTSDWHLNHRRIAEYCGRPANHQDLILERTAALVRPQDVLYHLGDFWFRGRVPDARAAVDALPGGWKILVAGNHDQRRVRNYKGWSESVKWQDQPLVRQFHVVPKVTLVEAFQENISIPIVTVYFSHKPPRDEEIPPNVLWFHGHIHNLGVPSRWVGNSKVVNACVEHTGYAPLDLGAEIKKFHEERSEVQL